MSPPESERQEEVKRRIRWNRARREFPRYRCRMSHALGREIPLEDFLDSRESEELSEEFERRMEGNYVFEHVWREDQEELVWTIVGGMVPYVPDTTSLLLAENVPAVRLPTHLMFRRIRDLMDATERREVAISSADASSGFDLYYGSRHWHDEYVLLAWGRFHDAAMRAVMDHRGRPI